MAIIRVTVHATGGHLVETKFSDRNLMRNIGLTIREHLISRTKSGLDQDGRSFEPYSYGYFQEKADALGSASPVNLEVSGRMLQGLILTDVSEDSVTIGYKD